MKRKMHDCAKSQSFVYASRARTVRGRTVGKLLPMRHLQKLSNVDNLSTSPGGKVRIEFFIPMDFEANACALMKRFALMRELLLLIAKQAYWRRARARARARCLSTLAKKKRKEKRLFLLPPREFLVPCASGKSRGFANETKPRQSTSRPRLVRRANFGVRRGRRTGVNLAR